MKFFHKIYEFSISPQLSHRIIFWGTLTILNAITGYILSIEGSFDIMGKILGIGTWIAIYVWFVAPRYIHHTNSILRTSIFSAYIAKTISILFYPIANMLEFAIGLLNLSIMGILVSFFPILEDSWNKILTYSLTLMHGLSLSLLTLILAYVIYLIRTMSTKVASHP